MSAEDSEKFKIRMDDDDVPEEVTPEIEKEKPPLRSRVDRRKAVTDPLGKRLTWTAIFLLILILAVAGGGFYEIKKLHSASMVASTTAVADLYREIEARLNTISQQTMAQEVKMGEEIGRLEKDIKKLETLKTTVDKVKASSVGKKELDQALEDMTNKISAVQSQAEALASEIKSSGDALKKKVDTIAASDSAREKTLKAFQIRQSNLEAEKISVKTLQDALQKQEDQFNLITAGLKKEINALRAEIVKSRSQSPQGGGGTSSGGSGVIEQDIH